MTARHRVLITGSRTWDRVSAIHGVLDRLRAEHGTALTVVHGACPKGADAIADVWCRRNRVSVERYPADWTTGRGAGHRRNAVMVDTRPAACIAFILDHSPGATGCANLAERAKIPTTRYRIWHHRTDIGAMPGVGG